MATELNMDHLGGLIVTVSVEEGLEPVTPLALIFEPDSHGDIAPAREKFIKLVEALTGVKPSGMGLEVC